MRMADNFKIFLAFVLAGSFVLPPGSSIADSVSEINMVVGDLQTITVNKLSRISVTTPEVADISDAQSSKVLIMGKKPGQTALFLWDKDGKKTITVQVAKQDLNVVKDRLRHLLENVGITTLELEANPAEGKVVIYGDLSKDKKAALDRGIEAYADQVINLVKEKTEHDLVQIDMQITELSTTLDRNLGFDWQSEAFGGPLNLDYVEGGTPGGGSSNWFKLGRFDRTSRIMSTIHLLVSEGKARDLSRPRILVTSGKEATINVGGEVPVQSQTTNSSGGSTQTNVTFKQYGVTLTVTPTIMDGKIDVVMNLQVTDVDRTFPIQASSTSDIAYKTRSAQTQLMLEDRQTVIFAGLIRYTDGEQIKRVPLLSKIPVLGGLFRNNAKQAPDEGKELVVTLTPTIMKKKEYAQNQMKMPTQAMNDFEKEVDQARDYAREPINSTSPALLNTSMSKEYPHQEATPAPVEVDPTIGLPAHDPLDDQGNKPQPAFSAMVPVGGDSPLAVGDTLGQQDDSLTTAVPVLDVAVVNAGTDVSALSDFSQQEVTGQSESPAAGDFSREVASVQSEGDPDRYVQNPLPADADGSADAVDVVGMNPGIAAYVRAIQIKISRGISYPYAALRQKLDGTVKLQLRVLKDGSLAEAEVISPSGHKIFDEDALNTAKISAPFEPFNSRIPGNDLTITVPIIYSHNAVTEPDTQAAVPMY